MFCKSTLLISLNYECQTITANCCGCHGRSSMGRHSEYRQSWGVNRLTAQFARPISVVLQHISWLRTKETEISATVWLRKDYSVPVQTVVQWTMLWTLWKILFLMYISTLIYWGTVATFLTLSCLKLPKVSQIILGSNVSGLRLNRGNLNFKKMRERLS